MAINITIPSYSSVAMVSRVTTCEGVSTDYSFASLPDTPFTSCYIYLQFPNVDLVNKSLLNTA